MTQLWLVACVSLVMCVEVSPGARSRRSLSCSLGTGGCKWTCRLRGYIRGQCNQGGDCQCEEVNRFCQKVKIALSISFWLRKQPNKL